MKFMFAAGDQPLPGYTIKRAIHRGGFGEVYYARTDAGKEVALKLLHDNQDVELRGVSQCLNLKHPQLVTIFDVKIDADGDHWIVMEYIAGQTLAERLRQFPAGMPHAEVSRIFAQLAQGLEFLHSRSLVHRDLKPANIFLEGENVKIGDVGLSKFIGPSRRSAQTQSVGTVHYMAPELARGEYGRGVDLYALGIILYEMLTGRVPFEGDSTGEILLKHLTQTPDFSGLAPPWRDVLRKALEKEEERRFQSIEEFEQAFTQALTGNQALPVGGTTGANVYKEGLDAGKSTPKQQTRGRFEGWSKREPVPPFTRAARSFTATQAREGRFSPEKSRWGLPGPGSWWWLVAMALLLVIAMRNLRHLHGSFRLMAVVAILGAAYYCYRRLNARLPQQAPILPDRSARFSGEGRDTAATCNAPGSPVSVTRPSAMLIRSAREQNIALLQSLALTPMILLLIAGTIVFFSRDFFSSFWHPGSLDLGQFGFFVASATLASWGVLTINQWCRRLRPDFTFKKLLLLGSGIGAGLGVFGLSEWLLVQYPSHHFQRHSHGMFKTVGRFELAELQPLELPLHWQEEAWPTPPPHLLAEHSAEDSFQIANFPQPALDSRAIRTVATHYSPQRSLPESSWGPTAAGYAVFFGLLFSLRAWDRLLDYRRQNRLVWFSVAVSAGLAYVICCFFAFPVVWGMTWAAAITAAVQLASPCVYPLPQGSRKGC